MEKKEVKTIMVEREIYEKNDKQFYSYFIRGNLRGIDVRVGVKPHDIGGYKVLEVVFNGEKEAQLVTKPWEIKDEKTGKVSTGNTFAVVSYDEDGSFYECAIKPSQKSDKDLLAMLLSK